MRTGTEWWLHRQVRGPASTLVLLALVVLGGFWPAAAQERAPAATTAGSMSSIGNTEVVTYLYLPLVLRAYDPDVLIDEGFEGGAVPPAGWTLIRGDPDPRWNWRLWTWQDYSPPIPGPYEGSYSTACDPGPSPQNEVLLSPQFQSTTAQLEFYSFGVRWSFVEYHLNVWLVVGEWDGGEFPVDDVLVHDAVYDWPTDPYRDWEWSLGSVDLTPFLPSGQSVRVAFQYDAEGEGELAGLDAILITR